MERRRQLTAPEAARFNRVDIGLFLRALVMTRKAQLVRRLPVPTVVEVISRRGGGGPDLPVRRIELATTRAVARWRRWFGGLDTCLTRSLVLGGLLAWVLVLLEGSDTDSDRDRDRFLSLSLPDLFALVLLGLGLLLPLSVEFIYLRDLFGTRMNTVFKFYFQAWVLLALASAYAVSVVSSRIRGVGGVTWRLGLTVLVLADTSAVPGRLISLLTCMK